MRRSCAFVCAVAMAGCGNDDGEAARTADQSCALTVTLTGAVEMTTSGTASCDASGSYPSGPQTVVTMIGLPGDQGDFMKFELYQVSEGAVGTFQAEVGVVRPSAQQGWNTPAGACMIEVAEHKLVDDNYQDDREYRIGGTGSCDQSAAGPSGTVDIGDFTMRGMLFWKK